MVVRPQMVTTMAGGNVHLLAQKVHERITALREEVTNKESPGWSSSETSSLSRKTDSYSFAYIKEMGASTSYTSLSSKTSESSGPATVSNISAGPHMVSAESEPTPLSRMHYQMYHQYAQ